MASRIRGCYESRIERKQEHNLNTKPLEVDLLIIKKASLYKSYGETKDERKADDITVSIVREAYPRELFKYFREHDYMLKNPWQGIYYIEGNIPFPTQIIVTKKLDKNTHAWLRALSENLKKKDIEILIDNIQYLTEIQDREMADSILEVSLKANRQIVQELIGDDRMYETLIEFMEPRLILRDKTKIEEGLQQGLQKGIRGTVNSLRKFGIKDAAIKTAIMENYGLSEDDAEKYL